MKTYKLTKKQVVNYYGNQAKVATVLGISRQAVNAWNKYVPEDKAILLIKITAKKIIPKRIIEKVKVDNC